MSEEIDDPPPNDPPPTVSRSNASSAEIPDVFMEGSTFNSINCRFNDFMVGNSIIKRDYFGKKDHI